MAELDTKVILNKKLNQLFVLFRYANDVKIPISWFEVAVPVESAASFTKSSFKIVNIIDIHKDLFEKILSDNNSDCLLLKDKKTYYFFKKHSVIS